MAFTFTYFLKLKYESTSNLRIRHCPHIGKFFFTLHFFFQFTQKIFKVLEKC